MLYTKTLYSYNDVMIEPAVVSEINSRSECNPYKENGKLPIFTAPMSTVVDEDNFNKFEDNGINTILPRNIDEMIRYSYVLHGKWAAFSLNEFKAHFCDEYNKNTSGIIWKVLIDVANGHMKQLYDAVDIAKSIHQDKIQIMIGNIANPETYFECYKHDIWGVRCGIGGGNGCFIDGTKVTTKKNGKKNIEDIQVGEEVLTHDGNFCSVLNKIRYKTNKPLLCINNEITCTKNHKFLVVNKEDKNKVTEDNLSDFSYWVEAEKLDKNVHLLIKRIEEDEDV